MEQVGSHYTDIRAALLISSGNSSFIKIGQKYQILNEDLRRFMIMSVRILPGRRKGADESCRENPKTYYVKHFLFSKIMSFTK